MNRLIRPLAVLLALATLSLTACAQDGALIIVRDAMGNDVTRSIALERGSAAADANSVKLNAAIQNVGKQKYTFAFPAGDFYFGRDETNEDIYAQEDTINGTCILLNRSGGQALIGKGQGPTRDETDNNGELVGVTRLIYAGPKVNLASTTHTRSGADITFSAGYTVKAQDVGMTVQILSGTGVVFAPQFRVVTAVNTGTNTLTLDYAPGGTGAITGLMSYSLIRDPGFGTAYKGLLLKGGATVGGTKCHVGIHFASNPVPINNGKAWLEQLSWSDFTAAVVCGHDMRWAYNGDHYEYTGFDDEHCDHITIIRPYYQNTRTGFYTRNSQSVCHHIIDPRFHGDIGGQASEFVYAEYGGEIKVEGGDFSGTDVSALRLGRNGANVASFHYEDCRFDTNSTRPKWLSMDKIFGGHNSACFQLCRLDEGVTVFADNLWECKGGMNLVLDQCSPIRSNSLLLTQVNAGAGLYWVPHAQINTCTIMDGLGSPLAFDEPFDVIDAADSTANMLYPSTVTFTGINTDYTGRVLYDNGRYLWTTSGDAAAWAAGYPLPTP